MIAEYKGADDDIVRWQSADGTVKTAHINDLILAYEPKKGKWIYHEPLDVFECSVCGRQMVRNIFNYCPWCGAKMERSEE